MTKKLSDLQKANDSVDSQSDKKPITRRRKAVLEVLRTIEVEEE